MSDQYEAAMRNYARLAVISWQRKQLPGRDRLLVLCGAAACRAGFLNVASRCRELVQEQNPRHLLQRYDSFPDAMRSEEFAPYLRQLERQCSPEHAEFLLERMAAAEGPAEEHSVQSREDSVEGEPLEFTEADVLRWLSAS